MSSKKEIKKTTRLKLWVKSAGRCQFKGCNEPVWRNNLTLSETNFADVAHIIGSSKKGPRGNEQSEELQTSFDNLMLLCKRCHKEIDSFEEKYGVEKLREWKRLHEERIEILTSVKGEQIRTTLLQFRARIGDFIPEINTEAMLKAVLPKKYPIDKKGIQISFPDFNDKGNLNEWKLTAEKIKKKIDRALDRDFDEHPINHLSIFAIAPMPLLMYLGRCVGDIMSINIYESHRNIADTNSKWSWKEEDRQKQYPKFQIEETEVHTDSKNVILLLCISDDIQSAQYQNLMSENTSVYKIYADETVTGFIKSPRQIEEFSKLYRKTLNQIQKDHGVDCKIYICPAIPISIAVECGRALLPLKESNIRACQYDKDSFQMIPVLRLC